MKRALYLLIPVAFIMVAIAPGCYTMWSHPAGEGRSRIDHTSDCVQCHFEFDDFPYGYYYSPYPEYWWDYDNYGYYYAYPWWWEHLDSHIMADRDSKFDRRDLEQDPPIIILPPHDPGPPWIPYPPPSPPSPPPHPPNPRPPSEPEDTSGPREKEPREKPDEKERKPGEPSRPKPQPDPQMQPNDSKSDTPVEKPGRSEGGKKSPRGGGRGR